MTDPQHTPSDPQQDEDPDASGTLFIMIIFLMALAGMWLIMYFRLLER